MNQKLLSKVLATMLAVILTLANFVTIGVYGVKSYATTDSLENQKTVSNNVNVKFDAYFVEANSKIHTVQKDMDETTKLNLAVNVETGYLKNAKIQALGEDGKDANFKILNDNTKLQIIESINQDKNTVELKQINAGTGVVVEIPIASIKTDLFDLSNFNKINNITLTGSYVDNAGKTINIEKTINVKVEWTKAVKQVIEQQTKTFIPYEVTEKEGTILQTVLKTGLENNSLPIKQTSIIVNVPEFAGVKPERILVNANSIKATNNKDQKEFVNENWNYDEEKGIINIQVNNEPVDNKVAWNKTDKDEYVITYIFDRKIAEVTASQKAEVTITPYNVTTALKQENTLNIEEKEIKGNFVTTEISSNDILSKGYLYSKSEKELEYNENIKLEIAYANLADKIIVDNNIDNFVNSKEQVSPTTISNINYAYYKSTSISKLDFERILGIDGYVKIIGKDGEQLEIFTKETTPDENGNYTYIYEDEINQIKIETSKPITEGILQINNVKSLKGKTDYSKSQIEDFQKLQLKTTTNVEYANTIIETKETLKDTTLVAPSTKVEVGVNKTNLSTVVKNENVELRIALKTNDITCDLYKNPTIEVVLPNYISELRVKDVDILFDDQLKIKNTTTNINENKNIVVTLQLEGEQTSYSQNEISKGANIVINTDITLKKLTPTREDIIKVYVTNENVTTYETVEQTKTRTVSNVEKGFAQTSLKAVAPTGMVTTSTITNYNTKGETVTSISGEVGIGKLDAKSSSKQATVKMDVINNYNNKINNIKILGRMPKAGNKSVVSNEDLGSNLNLTTTSLINLTVDGNYTVYYSTNDTATEDLNNVQNAWNSSVTDINTVKSYLIVFNEYEMNTGDSLSFNYNVNIPENIEYNKSVYTNYVVFFDNIKEEGTIKDKQIATKTGLTTGQGPSISVSINADVNDKQEVQEGSIIKYTAVVRNTGSQVANNVTLSGNIPEGTVYMYYDGIPGGEDIVTKEYDSKLKEYSVKIAELKPDETKTIEYMVEVKSLNEENTKNIEARASAKVENYDATFTSEAVTNTIIKGYLKVEMEMSPSYEEKKEGQEFSYITTITNVNNTPKENVVVTDKLPDGVSFVSAGDKGVYNKDTNTVTWNLGTVTPGSIEILTLNVKINELNSNEYRKDIKNSMTVKTSEKELISNEVSCYIARPVLVIKQEASGSDKVQIGDTIEYNVTIKNLGETDANNVIIKDYMPDGLLYRGSTYVVDGETYSSWIGNTEANISISTIKAGKTVDLTIKALVDDIEENKTERKVINIVALAADGVKGIGSNAITHTIVPKQEVTDPSTDEVIEGTHKISGLVWLDDNKDGKRDDTEKILTNVPVLLVNAETGNIVKDIVTKEDKLQKTNESGKYVFENITSGKYLVIFFYDTVNYDVTKYKADGVIDSKNSDVIAKEVTLNGETDIAAVADIIQISGADINNIDMGLIVKQKFDLKLDKSISKITVNTNSGTKTYNYNDTKLAKVDIKDKELVGATVIVEYKIRVTNEGEAAGYAKKIVDYIPQDMKFNSELNPDWYVQNSNNAFNASLANTLIQPGETKEVTLILTKTMTNENTGTVNNVAEIYEASNDLGLQDIDSTPANKVQSEDDYSLADVIIGVKTGEVYVYLVITFISVAILGVGIYFIKKKVLSRI